MWPSQTVKSPAEIKAAKRWKRWERERLAAVQRLLAEGRYSKKEAKARGLPAASNETHAI
jgi:hypothetical protein